MKEFTVYPKKPTRSDIDNPVPELLLLLNEDGSFRQYDGSEHANIDVEASWKKFQKQTKQQLQGFIKGTWDYIDGNLILAADRPEHKPYSALADGYNNNNNNHHQKQGGSTSNTEKFGISDTSDTLLKGRIVASYQTRLVEDDHPVIIEDSSSFKTNSTTQESNAKTTTALDTHLFVPKGSINIGKFFYPKHHPSFFEQPMFQPVKKGTFVLRQILGTLNTARDTHDPTLVERFQRRDFYNKTFLLTSHPLKQQQIQTKKSSKNTYWSDEHKQFVSGKDSKRSSSSMANIRVMQVAFHANNTFSTVAGLGESAILRGKFDVIGEEKNQLWMQVMRFGFGRSVSGSVYSEGRMLTHEDAKTYWGSIKLQDETIETTKSKELNKNNNNHSNEPTSRLEVEGSVLVGWGLEPLPVARFIMRETTDKLHTAMEDEDDDDEEELDDEQVSENMAKLDPGLQGDGIDWTTDDGGMFQ
jgi:hypothetical protein